MIISRGFQNWMPKKKSGDMRSILTVLHGLDPTRNFVMVRFAPVGLQDKKAFLKKKSVKEFNWRIVLTDMISTFTKIKARQLEVVVTFGGNSFHSHAVKLWKKYLIDWYNFHSCSFEKQTKFDIKKTPQLFQEEMILKAILNIHHC